MNTQTNIKILAIEKEMLELRRSRSEMRLIEYYEKMSELIHKLDYLSLEVDDNSNEFRSN